MSKLKVLVLLMCGLHAMSASATEGEDLEPSFYRDDTIEVIVEIPESDFCAMQRSPYGLTGEALTEHFLALQDGPCAVTYEIGDIGQAGGRVFYTTADGRHGMESAPNDITGLEWGCHRVQVEGVTNFGIGDGYVNSKDLEGNACASVSRWGGHTISDAVRDYDAKGFKDWYIPSREEMSRMYSQLTSKGVGNFARNLYWVSSVLSSGDNRFTWMVSGGDARLWVGERSLRKPVRPIRSF